MLTIYHHTAYYHFYKENKRTDEQANPESEIEDLVEDDEENRERMLDDDEEDARLRRQRKKKESHQADEINFVRELMGNMGGWSVQKPKKVLNKIRHESQKEIRLIGNGRHLIIL